MSQDSGRGAVISKNIPIIQNELLSWSRMAACKHANGRDWWIIKNAWYENIYYEFLLTPDGVQGPFIQQIGPVYGVPDNEQPSFSLFNQEGSKYVSFTSNQSPIIMMDFDRCSGVLSNPSTLRNSDSPDPRTPSIGGVSAAFSPDDRFLYIVSDPFELNQYDLQSPNVNDSIRIVTLPDTNFYELHISQLAPNGKIYISCWNGGLYKIHVINSPDSLGAACDFQLYGQSVLSQNSVAIPYQPNFRLSALTGSCDTIHTNITDIVDAHPTFASVSPNPASDQASLFYSTNSNSQNRAEIFDITGNLIWNSNTVGSSGNININLSAMPAGIYLVRFTADDNILLNTKLVVTK
jgi:outer membrane protein assembly factor BamB